MVKEICEDCQGTGEVEKTIWRGDEGMEIEMDVVCECSQCDGGWHYLEIETK